MARRMSSPILVGREAELRAFDVALQEARDGRPVVIVVGGEAGVGKTRLVAEFAARTRQVRGTAVVGAAPPSAGGAPIPFAALTPALRGLVRALDARLIDTVLGAARGDLAALLPELGPWPGRTDVLEPFAAARLAGSVLVTIEAVARLRPALLVALEDVQWADDATRAIVTYICRNLVDARVVVVVTHRTDAGPDDGATPAFIAELSRVPGAERIELGPLGADEVGRQVQAILGSDPEAEIVRALVRRSDGNPFFVEELLASVVQGGLERPPPSVRAMVEARLASLSEPARWLVEIAAIADPDVPIDLLAVAAAMAPRPFDQAMHEAREAHLIVRTTGLVDRVEDPTSDELERLDLRHVLVREVIVSSLSAPRRRELHARMARAMEAQPALAGGSAIERNARLASHLILAGELDRAIAPLMLQAAAAEAARAFVVADQAYRRVLDASRQLGFDAGVHPGFALTLERAAQAASLAGDPARAVALAAEALAMGGLDPEAAVRLQLHLGEYQGQAGEHDPALATLSGAAESAPPASVLHVRCVTALARELIVAGRLDEAEQQARAAADEAAGLRARAEQAAARSVEANALARQGRIEDALAALRLAPATIARAARSRSRSCSRPSRFSAAVQAYVDRASVFEQAGDPVGAARVALDGRAEAARRGLSATLGAVMAAIAARDLLRSGAWDEAGELVSDPDSTSDGRSEPARAMSALVRAQLACWRGDWDASERDLALGRAHLPAVEGPGWVALADLVEAEMAGWRRHHGQARTTIARGIEMAERDGDRIGLARLAVLGIRVEADAAVSGTRRVARDRTSSEEIAVGLWIRLQAAVDDARRRPSPQDTALIATGASELDRLLRVLGRPDDQEGLVRSGTAMAAWDAAVAACEAAGDPYSGAYARSHRAGAVLVIAGDRAAARADLRMALVVAERLGALPLCRQIEQLARRARLTSVRDEIVPERSWLPGYAEARRLGLSDREVEVLAALAAGSSDREIAEGLFITTKTAGHHVSHILAKLGVGRRGEAAAIAFRIGLAPPDG